MTWLQRDYPLRTNWGSLNRQIIRAYLNTYSGKSANYRRLAMQPILQTSGFMHREFGFVNFGERLGIGGKLAKPPVSVFLEDVSEFVEHIRETESRIEAGVCLQGLTGLQMLEVLRLTWDKVDLDRGILEITGEVKNVYRNRVIPVCGRVREALVRELDRQQLTRSKVQELRSPVVVTPTGRPYNDFTAYSKSVKKALLSWNSECEWAPKDLRNCLPTFAKLQGIHGTLWEQYIGHAPTTATERHYVPRLASKTKGEKGALDRHIEVFRRLILEPLEEGLEGETCNFLQLDELREETVGI